MSTWTTVLVGCLLAYGLKLSGYVVPASWLEGRQVARITALLPAALLTGLIVTQTVGGPRGSLTVDARVVALGVAVVLLLLRRGFLVVVIAGAATAAGLRAMGWG